MSDHARSIEALEAQLSTLRTERDTARHLLRELYTLVCGECPSLLNEDSGGDARLALSIEAALPAAQETPK